MNGGGDDDGTQLINIDTLHPAIPVITCTQWNEVWHPWLMETCRGMRGMISGPSKLLRVNV